MPTIHATPVPSPAALTATRRLRVLHVVPGEAEGVNFIFAKRQIRALAERGVETRTYFLPSRTSLAGLLASYRDLRDAIRDFDPQLVHAHYGTVTALFTRLATLRPVVITFCGSDLNGAPSKSWFRSNLACVLSQVAAALSPGLIAVSEGLRDRLWWRRRATRVVRHGIDLEEFRPVHREEARRRLGWPSGQKVVLMNAGRDPVVKRLDLATEAIEIARKAYPELHFEVMRGEIPPEDVPILMNAADVLVLTSEREGSPNVVKEAIACNLPVVSVDVGDVAERLDGVEPSRIVPRDPQAIGAALVDVLSLQTRADGRETMRLFSSDASAEQVLALYGRLTR